MSLKSTLNFAAVQGMCSLNSSCHCYDTIMDQVGVIYKHVSLLSCRYKFYYLVLHACFVTRARTQYMDH